MWDYIYLQIEQISTLSTYEYISLIAQFHSIDQENEIDPRLLDRGFTEDQLNMLKQQLEMKTKTEMVRTLNLKIHGNLDRFKYEHFNYVMAIHDAFSKHGLLPYQGVYTEQPSKIIEIFNVLDQLSFERDRKIQEKHNKEMKK